MYHIDNMETEKMINMALAYKGISQSELARLLGTTSSNFNQKIKRGAFSREELGKIAAALGGEYKNFFEFPDGTKIGG
jgi:transcriptional regulator